MGAKGEPSRQVHSTICTHGVSTVHRHIFTPLPFPGTPIVCRVWDLVTGAQRYQFSSPSDQPTCVTYAPPRPTGTAAEEELHSAGGVASGAEGGEGDGEERHLVAGYASGSMRVFDVLTTCTLFECQQHRGSVQQVRGYTPNSKIVVVVAAYLYIFFFLLVFVSSFLSLFLFFCACAYHLCSRALVVLAVFHLIFGFPRNVRLLSASIAPPPPLPTTCFFAVFCCIAAELWHYDSKRPPPLLPFPWSLIFRAVCVWASIVSGGF